MKRGEKVMRVKEIPQITRLSASEKILLVEDIWDSIAADESSVPIPRSHVAELEERLSRYTSTPGDLLSMDELSTKINSRK